eukprot:13374564-Alexandrium_andersonii.AAC.1
MPRQSAVSQAGGSLAREGGDAEGCTASLPPPTWSVELVAGSKVAGGLLWAAGGGTEGGAPGSSSGPAAGSGAACGTAC